MDRTGSRPLPWETWWTGKPRIDDIVEFDLIYVAVGWSLNYKRRHALIRIRQIMDTTRHTGTYHIFWTMAHDGDVFGERGPDRFMQYTLNTGLACMEKTRITVCHMAAIIMDGFRSNVTIRLRMKRATTIIENRYRRLKRQRRFKEWVHGRLRQWVRTHLRRAYAPGGRLVPISCATSAPANKSSRCPWDWLPWELQLVCINLALRQGPLCILPKAEFRVWVTGGMGSPCWAN